MPLRAFKFSRLSLLTIVLVVAMTTTVWATQGSHRTTRDLKKDLRATRLELKNFDSLQSKLSSSERQSSNAARQSVISKLQKFMGECILRREDELGEEITLKQHGKDVKSGTTDVAKVGTPVSVKNSGRGLGVYSTTNGGRMSQLSYMKSIYVGAKNNSRLAIEKQTGAFERYTATVAKFGQQLQMGINGMNLALDRREAEARAKKEKAAEALRVIEEN